MLSAGFSQRSIISLSAAILIALPSLSQEPLSQEPGSQGMKEMNPPAEPDPNAVTAVVGGRLIDGRGGTPIDDSVVIVRGDRVIATGPRDRVSIPAGAAIVSAEGMSVLPGLIDSHFHSINDLRLPLEFALHRGVTSFRDPGHPFKYYSVTLQSTQTMPRIFLCGGHLDAAPVVWPDQAVVIASAEDARQAVNSHVDRGASAIKVYFRLPLDHVRAACEAAEERGVLVTSHLELLDAGDAIEAGVRGVEHVTSFGVALASPVEAKRFQELVRADSSAREEWRHRMWAKIDLDRSPRLQPLLDQLKQRGVFVSPTLAIFEKRPGEKNATAAEVAGFANMQRFVGICHREGIKVVVGSHTWAPFAELSHAHLRELELLVDSGLTPLEAITAATLHNAEFFGIADRLGVLEAGKTADLIVVDGDPSVRISDLRKIDRVMLNGIWVSLPE